MGERVECRGQGVSSVGTRGKDDTGESTTSQNSAAFESWADIRWRYESASSTSTQWNRYRGGRSELFFSPCGDV